MRRCWDSVIARFDLLLSELRDTDSLESDDQRFSVKIPAWSWADRMNYVKGLTDTQWECFECAGQPQLQLQAQQEDDVLDIELDI